MSMSDPTNFACPNCGEMNEFDVFASVNADRRPDLRDDIVSGEFMRIKCSSCQIDFRPEPDLNYLDFENGLWIQAKPLGWIAHWADLETEAAELFDAAYGSGAPASAREIGDELKPRITFGWSALREKIVIAQEELDDIALEETKIAVLRNKPDNPVEPGVELRLISVHDPVLQMGWIRAATNEALQVFEVQRALYEDISGDEGWADLGKQLSAGYLVDTLRLFIAPTPYEPEAAE